MHDDDDLSPPPPIPDNEEDAFKLATKIKLLSERMRFPPPGYGFPIQYRGMVQYERPLVRVHYERAVEGSRTFIPSNVSSMGEHFARSLEILQTGLPITSIIFREEDQGLLCTLHMTVRDRENFNPVPLVSQFMVAWHNLVGCHVHDFDEMILYRLRHLILDGLKHELDECIFFRGKRLYDPHRNEYPPTVSFSFDITVEPDKEKPSDP